MASLIGFVPAVWIAQLQSSAGDSMESIEEQQRILELNNPKVETNGNWRALVAPLQ
jgi:hypothetical protein